MPADPAPRHHVAARSVGIAAALTDRGLAGPALVVADDTAIAAYAPAWAAELSAAGVVHRVVVPGVDVVAAAAGLGARVVVAAGSVGTIAAARAAAAALGVPLVEARATLDAPSCPGPG